MSNIFKYTKVCSVCGEEKGLCDFVHQRGKPQARCKECNNNQAKAHFRKSVIASKAGSPWFTTMTMKIYTFRKKQVDED